MIAKAVKGRGFRGAIAYDLSKDGGRILDTNMAGDGERELAAEFGAIRKLRPNLEKAVLHVSLSAAPAERLSDAQWQAIGRRYLTGMELVANQYLITRHTDTEHEHIHILANRITNAGQVVSDSKDYQRQEALMREIEREYGLKQLAPSIESARRAPSRGEIEKQLRTAEVSTRVQLQQLADAAAKGCLSYSEYQERLEAAGVELVPVVQLDGAKLSGLVYRLDGVTMKGSDLGKAYSPSGLAKRGVSYEQDRDAAAIRASHEREAARGSGQPGADGPGRESAERRGPEQAARAIGAGTGGAERGRRSDAERDRPADTSQQRGLQAPARQRDQEPERRDRAGQPDRGQPEPGREPARMEALRSDGVDRDGFGDARERILALAGAADRPEPAGRQGGGRVPQTGRDRSLEAVQRQVAALGAAGFDVEIRGRKETLSRRWSPAELEGSLAWLKRMNARGAGVFLRPSGEPGLVLISGLREDGLEQMKREGFAPAVTLEVSPGGYEAWVKLSEEAVPERVRQVAHSGLVARYGGEVGRDSSDGHPFGRLAGLTNQDPQYAQESARGKLQPYVLAKDCNGRVATAAPTYLQHIEKELDALALRRERARRLEVIREQVRPERGDKDPGREYRWLAQRRISNYGDSGGDLAAMDLGIAKDMAKDKRFTVDDIAAGIAAGTPNVQSLEFAHGQEYAWRLGQEAWKAPEVVRARQERELQARREQERGWSRGPNRDGPSR